MCAGVDLGPGIRLACACVCGGGDLGPGICLACVCVGGGQIKAPAFTWLVRVCVGAN